jgi:homoserine dehydrogenase
MLASPSLQHAFSLPLSFDAVAVEGIAQRQATTCAMPRRRRRVDGIELRVQPALVPQTSLLAHVDGAMNGVLVKSNAAGPTTYCGAGAGRALFGGLR